MAAATIWLIAAGMAQAAIALVLLAVLGRIRLPLVQSGAVRLDAMALSRDPWPEREKRVSNAFDNQFQLPVLFYAAVGLSLYFGAGWIEVVLAWLFVASRIVHAAVFASSNNVMQRFSAYALGYTVLVLMWIELLVRLVGVMLGGR